MASDTRITYISCILVFFSVYCQFVDSSHLKVSLSWHEPWKRSPHSLVLSIDPYLVIDSETKGFKKDFDAINAMSMAAELAPAFLLMGGSTSDKSCFHFEPSVFSAMTVPIEGNNRSACCHQNSQKMVITGEQLLLLSSFAEEAGLKIILTLGYDHNLHHKRTRSGNIDADECLAWDENQATKLFHFANMMNISLNYQLGYEILYNSQCVNNENCVEEWEKLQEEAVKSGEAYGYDINRLRQLLDKYPVSEKSLIIPSGFNIPNAHAYGQLSSENSNTLQDILPAFYAQAYLNKSSENLDALVCYTSAFKDEFGKETNRYNTTILLNEMKDADQIFGKSDEDKQLWIGERYSDEFSNLPAAANEAFNVALNWVEHLGTISKRNNSAIFHSLKKVGEDSPDPKYWVSLLHKNLAGSIVADAQVMGANNTEEKYSFFAHCTPFSEKHKKSYIESFPRGSVTIYAANPSNKSRNVNIQVGEHIRKDESISANQIYEYVLTPEEKEGKYTGKVKLNEFTLDMSDNGAIPNLTGVPVKVRNPRSALLNTDYKEKRGRLYEHRIHRGEREAEFHDQIELFMPSKSIVFWVLPLDIIGKTPCIDGDEDTKNENEQFLSFYHRPLKEEANNKEKPREKRQIQRKSLAEISKRRVQARKIRPFADTRRKSPMKDKVKRESTYLRRKRRSRHRDRVPMTVTFDIDDSEEEPEDMEDGYEKGMLTLSEVIALSSKEESSFDDDFSDEMGKGKIKPGVLKGIWNLGKKLSDKVSPRRTYNGPTSHVMGLGRNAKPIAVINEPKRELFEAEFRGDEDEMKIDLKKEKDDEPNEDDYEHTDDYEIIEENDLFQDTKLMRDQTKDNGLKFEDILEPENMDSNAYPSILYDEFSVGEHRKRNQSSKNSRIKKDLESEEDQYFSRYKRKAEEHLRKYILNEHSADVKKNASRRYDRKSPLAHEDFDAVKNKKRIDSDKIISSPVISDKNIFKSPEGSQRITSENNLLNGDHEETANQLNDVVSNDISTNVVSHGDIWEKNLYSKKRTALNRDENDEASIDTSSRSERHVSVVPIDKRLGARGSRVSGRKLANKDVISRQLLSSQVEDENENGNVTNSTHQEHPRENVPQTAAERSERVTTPMTAAPPRRRMDANRGEQRRISMEAFRRRTIEERRKAMRDYREMLEERRQRRINSSEQQVVSVFKQGIGRTVQGLKAAQGRRVNRGINLIGPNDFGKDTATHEKVRRKRQSLMYNDSEAAEHHRVIRSSKVRKTIRKENPTQEVSEENSHEVWPVDKELGNIAENGFASKKPSTYNPQWWRGILRNEPRKSSYYSIDTDKTYKPGLYEVINEMFESNPIIDFESIGVNKSYSLREKSELNSMNRGKMKEDELLKERSLKKQDNVRKAIQERIQKAREERRKALEIKSRETRSIALNTVFDDDSLLTNKITKHKRTMSDKGKLLFYVIDENKSEPKISNNLDFHTQNGRDPKTSTPDPKVDLMNTSYKQNMAATRKVISDMKKYTDVTTFKDKEAKKRTESNIVDQAIEKSKGSNSNIKERKTSTYANDNSIFSHILLQLFKFMDSLHSVMSSPIR